jgi:cytochrome c-type biogenesis protein CcmE
VTRYGGRIVNKRARQRLIGVTAILFVVIAAIVVGTTSGGAGAGALVASVEDVLDDPELVGERVEVTGAIVEGSWDRDTRPMEFDIRDEEGDEDSPTLHIVYDGTVPATFGDGTSAKITGTYAEEGVIESSEMVVKCPSKYESETGALTVEQAVAESEDIAYARVAGYVASIGSDGLVLQNDEDGGETLEIVLDTALPENVVEGTRVVIDGSFDDGVFVATSIAEAAE